MRHPGGEHPLGDQPMSVAHRRRAKYPGNAIGLIAQAGERIAPRHDVRRE
jgi:hypothetical protein